ncbi:MAG TPA: CBS domain-containing protein [Kofleriaceae bacterium]|nr:CBS domain-containing protein [Kofleriaceae bacterium]
MTAPVATVDQDAALSLVARVLDERRVSAVPVVDGGAVVGVISRADLVRVGRIQAGSHHRSPVLTLPQKRAGDLVREAKRAPIVVAPSTPLRQTAVTMLERRIHRVFVVEGRDLVGVVSTFDMMRAVRDARIEQPITTIMSTPLFTINANQPVSAAVERLEHARVTGLVVLDDDFPVGLFTQLEALQSRDLPRDTRIDEILDPAMLCLPKTTKIYRAAEQACRMEVRRVIPCHEREAVGIVTGMDFVKLVAADH